MVSRAELLRIADSQSMAAGVVEKDYVILEVLHGLSKARQLREKFVFKGGTALRRVFFPEWRYSEDLDFTVVGSGYKESLLAHLDQWYSIVRETSEISLESKEVHKTDGYARVRVQFLGPLQHPNLVYLDLTFDEPVVLKAAHQIIKTEPFFLPEFSICTYQLEEILAEKLRSLLERGKSRDYYDVWRLVKTKGELMDSHLVREAFARKCRHKAVKFSEVADFFRAGNLAQAAPYWSSELAHFDRGLPPFDKVVEESKGLLAELFSAQRPKN